MYKNELTISVETLKKYGDKLVELECGCTLPLIEMSTLEGGPCPCFKLWIEAEAFEGAGGPAITFSVRDHRYIPVSLLDNPHPTPTDQPPTNSNM